jgi:benzoyl-CoA reductase/2-hydroxyglutaryl-CoA dehydratase subunit BcrC/BadD/HgdB
MEKLEYRLAKSKNFQKERGLLSTRLIYEDLYDHFKRAFHAKEQGEYVVWMYGYVPSEILCAMDKIVPFGMESYVYLAGVWGDMVRYLDLADSYGFSKDCCSSIRAHIGAGISGDLPEPKLILTSSQGCEAYKAMEFLGEYLRVPIISLDAPYIITDDNVFYYISQLEGLIQSLETISGEKMDYQHLERVVKEELQGAEYAREINEMRKAVPTPMKGRDAMRGYGGVLGSTYRKDPISFPKAVHDEIKERVEKREGAVAHERYRLLWCQTPPFYTDLTGYLEEKYGAVIAFNDPHKYIWWQKGEYDQLPPLEILARRYLAEEWNGPSFRRIEVLVQSAREYKVDAVIHFNHWGCRISSNHARLLKDKVWEELGIPTLILEGDYMDMRNYNEQQLKDCIEAFLERL